MSTNAPGCQSFFSFFHTTFFPINEPAAAKGLTLTASKTGLTILVDIFLTNIFVFLFFSKIFDGELLIRIIPTTLLTCKIFCENLSYS